MKSLDRLNAELIACRRCPRLVEHRETVARDKRAAYRDWTYWGKPVPGFGDPEARIVLVGLAPGAHGSNRTGRMFTGDGSGVFLYRVLHHAGLANQATATHIDDGLELRDAYITAAARCAPPGNKPTPDELSNCSSFLDREMALLKRIKVVVALGKVGWDAYLAHRIRAGRNVPRPRPAFGHGALVRFDDGSCLLGTYHPSQQNTFTGKLTESMMRRIFLKAKKLANESGV
jgi:uracil-DNA glycosylase family 4